MKKRILSPQEHKIQRIGRRTIRSARIGVALERRFGATIVAEARQAAAQSQQKAAKPKRKISKKLVFALAVIAVLIGGGWYGYTAYTSHQQEMARRDAEARRQVKAKIDAEKTAKQQACMQKVLAAKKDLIGKVTYDQLYDSECAQQQQ